MENNFVPYQIAIDMKAIGFDEPCFMYYDHRDGVSLKSDNTLVKLPNEKVYPVILENTYNVVKAPLYQQAFRFFREKYNIILDIVAFYDEHQLPLTYYNPQKPKGYFVWDYYDENFTEEKAIKFESYEEAELEGIKKLIEICKKN